MIKVFDASTDVTSQIPCLKSGGVETVIRYYAPEPPPSKVIQPAEKNALLEADLSLCIVYEYFGTDVGHFDSDNGRTDAEFCIGYAAKLHQPMGSAIYFAVDFDPTETQVQNAIIPYFQAVRETVNASGQPAFRIGVYGSGLVCQTMLDQQLADLTWLSQSSGFRGT